MADDNSLNTLQARYPRYQADLRSVKYQPSTVVRKYTRYVYSQSHLLYILATLSLSFQVYPIHSHKVVASDGLKNTPDSCTLITCKQTGTGSLYLNTYQRNPSPVRKNVKKNTKKY